MEQSTVNASKRHNMAVSCGMALVLLQIAVVAFCWFPGADAQAPQQSGITSGVVVSRDTSGRNDRSGGVAAAVAFNNAPQPYGRWWIVAAWVHGGATTVYINLNRTAPDRHIVSWDAANELLNPDRYETVPDWAAVGDEGINGQSSDAVIALAMVDAAEPGDLTGGLDVAASGTLHLTSGAALFGAVTHLAEKKFAAEQAGVDVLFVPTGSTGIDVDVVAERPHNGGGGGVDAYTTLGSWSATRARTGPLLVVAVDNLDEVVAFLCGTGATAACDLVAR